MKINKGKSYVEFSEDTMCEGALTVDMLFVSPEERGNKAGYSLLDDVISYAKDNGYAMVNLFAYPQEDGDDAITEDALLAYYIAYGFRDNEGICEYEIR